MNEQLFLGMSYKFSDMKSLVTAISQTYFKRMRIVCVVGAFIFVLAFVAFFTSDTFDSWKTFVAVCIIGAITFISPALLAAIMALAVKSAAIDNYSTLSVFETFYTEASSTGTQQANFFEIDWIKITDTAVIIYAGRVFTIIPTEAFAQNNVRIADILGYMQSKGANIPFSLLEKADRIQNNTSNK